MFQSTGRLLLLGGLLLCVFLKPAQAAVGGAYSIRSFGPWLERGYNTRLGWLGHPVGITDPHLYLHAPGTQALIGELEYLHAGGRIHTQLLKVEAPGGRPGPAAWQELEFFVLEAGSERLDSAVLHTLINKDCQGEWRHDSGLYLSLVRERSAIWLRISDQGTSGAQAFAACSRRPGKS